jgi:hypothetical protein
MHFPAPGVPSAPLYPDLLRHRPVERFLTWWDLHGFRGTLRFLLLGEARLLDLRHFFVKGSRTWLDLHGVRLWRRLRDFFAGLLRLGELDFLLELLGRPRLFFARQRLVTRSLTWLDLHGVRARRRLRDFFAGLLRERLLREEALRE